MRVDIDALYKRAKANLWVEDVETRTWLEAIWFGQTFTIQVLVARGRDSVQTMCKDAENPGTDTSLVWSTGTLARAIIRNGRRWPKINASISSM